MTAVISAAGSDTSTDGELSPGIYCTVEPKIPHRTPSLIVPAGAIVFDRDGPHVMVVEDGVAARSPKSALVQRSRSAVEPGDPLSSLPPPSILKIATE